MLWVKDVWSLSNALFLRKNVTVILKSFSMDVVKMSRMFKDSCTSTWYDTYVTSHCTIDFIQLVQRLPLSLLSWYQLYSAGVRFSIQTKECLLEICPCRWADRTRSPLEHSRWMDISLVPRNNNLQQTILRVHSQRSMWTNADQSLEP